ncbi:MAG: FxsA family protein [Methylotenera sp.]|nr:FxsA family protein [Methylotenera sp.]MDO9234122.1 FxsA family protein [Methylotenera sp.]MDO9234247.1 FxsA family protein [Methylotenera sp.]MDO9389398.1 FxsA family protein [Methylotenera sp.]MDP2103264.1 FxsA family protein [Methylotenera sp.]
MRLLMVLILLAFPIAEIWLLIELGQHYGLWLLVYLVMIALLGFRLIRDEKSLFSGRMAQTLSAGGNPIKAMFGSARNIIAGVLLILPGVITDVIAVILLLIPIKNTQPPNNNQPSSPYQAKKAANDDVIEGEFRRED